MSSLMDKMLKNSTIKQSAVIAESKVFGKKDFIPTQVPMINAALSGSLDGGLAPGLLTIAGPSKHFKSAFALLMAAAFQRRYEDGVVLFYDSEFGSPESYFESFGVDMSRVMHSPITDVEVLKHDIVKQLSEIDKKDNVMVLVDSIGNLASKKETDDALDGKNVADMSRAKSLKSFGRLVTPHLNLKDIPMVVINHTYKEIGLYPKDVVSGGTGLYYSSDAIWIIGRQQEKDGTEIAGYNFIINIEKSRHVREKSKIPVNVTFEGGINTWSGLFDVAVEGGFIRKPKVGWYEAFNPETGEVLTESLKRAKDLANSSVFWKMMLSETNLAGYVKERYTMAKGELIQNHEEETPETEQE